MSKKNPHIEETLEKLEELVHGQQRAMHMANEIISMKNNYIELCEMETTMYKKQAVKHGKIVLVLSVLLAITLIAFIFK